MRHSLRIGLSFGLTSGVITTLGLMVGLNSGTHSRIAVIGGVLTIAIADAMSDAMGMHLSEEAHKKRTSRQIWESTFSTFISKFAIALTFIFPLLVFRLDSAVIASIFWGLFLLSYLSFRIARSKGENPYPIVVEHLAIALIVIIITHFVGLFVSLAFA
ncbi:hypothetical protein KY345_03390 [Candidatus Woesearchaeota archaeon]|nr:hypothetical protein [Candidatus Woesearchaeota archaeon]